MDADPQYIHGTNLRLYKPPFLPAASIAGLELISRVDSNAMVCVVQGCKVVPGGAKITYCLSAV